MTDSDKLVDFELINEMLYGDEEFVREFATASITSISEFNNGFRDYLLTRDMENLRRAGHKIKPVAQMLNFDPIIENYEKAKLLLEQNATSDELHRLVKRMDEYCKKLIAEFKEIK